MVKFQQKSKRRSKKFSGSDSMKPVMEKVICSACGKECTVPFKPTGEKPVFCNDCFRSRRLKGPDRENFGRSRSRDQRMHKAICDKCGKECEVPFKPSGDKPIYCNECFNRGDRDRGSSQTDSQLEMISAKLDKILELLGPAKKKVTRKISKSSKSSKKISSKK